MMVLGTPEYPFPRRRLDTRNATRSRNSPWPLTSAHLRPSSGTRSSSPGLNTATPCPSLSVRRYTPLVPSSAAPLRRRSTARGLKGAARSHSSSSTATTSEGDALPKGSVLEMSMPQGREIGADGIVRSFVRRKVPKFRQARRELRPTPQQHPPEVAAGQRQDAWAPRLEPSAEQAFEKSLQRPGCRKTHTLFTAHGHTPRPGAFYPFV
mmetsp:Transcript_6618/g.15908  ORF Transcript_6618/g.15908 Transcript_6618/m.15908 type:complete len:209 (-) Transcript_6618:1-627(-)